MFNLTGEILQTYVASDTFNVVTDLPVKDLSGAAVTIAAGDRLAATDIIINNGATAAVYTIFQDRNNGGTVDAGEELFRVACAANSSYPVTSIATPIMTQRAPTTAANRKIKVLASAASVGSTVQVQWRRILGG